MFFDMYTSQSGKTLKCKITHVERLNSNAKYMNISVILINVTFYPQVMITNEVKTKCFKTLQLQEQ